jgi:5-methylcytosine-specific restriction endonuclease McrA
MATAALGAVVATHGLQSTTSAVKNLQKENTTEGGSQYKPGADFSKGTKKQVAEAAGGKCQICGGETVPGTKTQKGVPRPKNEGQTDHITPKSQGGTNDPTNAQHVCFGCNLDKGTKTGPVKK